MKTNYLNSPARLIWTLMAVASGATPSAVAATPPVGGILYSTGFETTDATPFSAGNLDGQGRWTVSEGGVVVQGAIARGAQSVQAGQASFSLSVATNVPVLWVDAFFLDPGSTNQPMIPSGTAGSVIFFSATQGFLALDGDGNGNGSFVQVAPALPAGEFTRVSLRHDYVNKTYDVWVNGARLRGGLRFKDNSVTGFTGIERRSNLDSYLDSFSVTTWGLDADSDADGLTDLDEVKFYGSHPLLADSDGDGMSDGQEVLAGTDPASAASVFAIRIDGNPPGQHRVRVPTITGRHYTVQRRVALGSGAWENVPGATGIAGDGTEQVFVQPGGPTSTVYRALVNP